MFDMAAIFARWAFRRSPSSNVSHSQLRSSIYIFPLLKINTNGPAAYDRRAVSLFNPSAPARRARPDIPSAP